MTEIGLSYDEDVGTETVTTLFFFISFEYPVQ